MPSKMSDEVKFLYIWMLCWNTAERLREFANGCINKNSDKIGVPGSKGPYYWCSSNKIKEIIG